jgi:two-component system CheB/CheR fusion protein
LLEALLDISRLDSGSLKPEIKTFEVDSLLSQLWDQYQAIARDKGLMLKLVPCSVLIRSDPALLRVILQNLISNAIKYTHRGNVIIECRRDGGLTSIEIRDSGIGITEEEQALIFEEFYQHDNQARDRNKGTGIGLAIVKRMADLLNHPIRIDSVEGKGSNFAIQVPVVDIAQLETDSIHPGAAWPVNDPAGHNILLIEDDEIVLHANYSLLTTLGNKVMPAADAETARKLLTSQSPPPDIIICDYRLPGECVGTELVRRLRAEAGRQIPAIMLTGDISVTDDNCGLPDICLWMQKPARVEKLVQAINQLLDVPLPQPDDRIQG